MLGDPSSCRVCGTECGFWFLEPTAHDSLEHGRYHFNPWCEYHCPDHDYTYDRDIRDWPCKWCNAYPPDDFYYLWDEA